MSFGVPCTRDADLGQQLKVKWGLTLTLPRNHPQALERNKGGISCRHLLNCKML